MKIIRTDTDKAMKDVIEAWLNGDQAYLEQVVQRSKIAAIRRKLLKVVDAKPEKPR